MNQPVIIGVTPLYDAKKESLWMLPGYLDGITQAGAVPIVLPLTHDVVQLRALFNCVDGILFTGGQDVNPGCYGEERTEMCGEICDERDRMEEVLLQLCRIKRKPVYGICRGIQFFNAILGGTLYQDLPQELPGSVEHHMTPPYDRAVHKVKVDKDSLLYRIIGKHVLDVNSYHHQGIRELAPCLAVSAWASDGLPEAVEDRRHPFFLATQWHPELFWEKDEPSRQIFAAFVEACRKNRNALGSALECDIL